MAVTRKTRTVINPAGGGRNRRRKLTPKQVKFFGTARQRAALKRKRRRVTAAASAKVHTRAPRRPAVKENPGEILSIVLNPSKGKKESSEMAHTKKRTAPKTRRAATHKRNAGASMASHQPRRRHRRQRNPAVRSHRRPMRKRNPSTPKVGGLITNALWIIAGAVGSKLITQAVLGAKNTGVFGYGGNALVTGLLGLGVSKGLRSESAGNAVIAGGVVQIVLRALTDFTPFGKYTSQLGLGDYLASNFVVPQRYVDPLNSAQVEIPQGWAPRVQLPPAAPAAAAGMGATGLYSGSSLY